MVKPFFLCNFVAEMKKTLLKSELVRNTGKLLSANVMAQVIGLIVYPILTRMYCSEDFGLLSLFTAIGSVLALIGTAEYQYAIVLPKDDRDAVGVVQLCGIILTGICLLTILAIPFGTTISEWFHSPALNDWLWTMPFYVLLLGMWSLLNYWLTRRKRFGSVAVFQLTQSTTGAGTKVAFGYAGWTNFGLILGAIIAPLLGLITAGVGSLKELRSLVKWAPDSIKENGRKYRNFPCFSLPRALVNNISGNLGVWMLTPSFGLEAVGFLGLAITLAFRPLNVISNSLYQVLFQRTSERVQNRESIRLMFNQLLLKIALFAGGGFGVLYWLLPTICRWLLGAEWEETGRLIQLMLPWLFFSILVAPICFLSDVFGKQKIGLVFELALMIARASALGVGIWLQSFHIAVLAYSLGSALVIAGQLVWYRSLIVRYERTLS